MFIVTMRKAEDMPQHFKPSSLIEVDSRMQDLRFVISYSAHPTIEKVGFNIYCRQIGENGLEIVDRPLIDMIVPDIVSGPSLDHIKSFLQKLISVECKIWYVYASHDGPRGDLVNISKWGSLFSNFSVLITIHMEQLDNALNERIVRLQPDPWQFGSNFGEELRSYTDVLVGSIESPQLSDDD